MLSVIVTMEEMVAVVVMFFSISFIVLVVLMVMTEWALNKFLSGNVS